MNAEKKKTIKKINNFIKLQKNKDTLRFITCGSVDDGKSTLIGRMLYDSKIIFNDQLESLKKDSNKFFENQEKIDFSLLLDGLIAEREQKITIDVAYRYFQTKKRRFIVADTPGHDQYTRNMVTGASTAKLAIILINAKKGIVMQTLRHSFICSLLGIKNIILAVNKMDLINYSKQKFENIHSEYKKKTDSLNFKKVISIPISASLGENITKRSKKLKWYKELPLLPKLENIKLSNYTAKDFIFSVQNVITDNKNNRGYAGIVRCGKVKVNEKVKIYPSMQYNIIKKIKLFKKQLDFAKEGQSITLYLKKETDVSRGCIISSYKKEIDLSDHFQSKLIWFSNNPGYAGRLYFLKIGNITLDAQITKIKNIINVNNFEYHRESKLVLNDIGVVEISINKKIPYETFDINNFLGSFILVDRITFDTVAAGMIDFSMIRSSNIFKTKLNITQKERNLLNGHKSKVLWFTGLSGSGKSTLAKKLEKKLYKDGIKTFILDGDNIRKGLNKDLGFKYEDRVENIRRIAEVSRIMVEAGVVVLVAFISPFRSERDLARSLFKKEEFIEIFVSASLKVVEKRDVKGLYKKARLGKIKNFTGISSPYEKPLNPEITLDTDKLTISKTVNLLYKKLNLKLS